MANDRTTLSYAIVLLFILCFLWAGLQNDLRTSLHESLALGKLPLFSFNSPEESFEGA